MVSAGLVASVLAVNPVHAEVSFGKPGDPVNLVVGYQPYYTQAWSGVVMRGKELWKRYLPAGSTVEFQVGLQGAIVVNAMTGEKQHIGYVGDMPAIAATFRNAPDRGSTDIRIVSVLGTSKQQCNIFLARNDAPAFASGVGAVKWMDGKTVASPQGSCTDRFARVAFEELGIQPASYLNQNIEVITTNFRAGKLDAAVIWEPTASKLEVGGTARRVASGEDFDALDAGFMLMLNDLLKQRPDIVRGWLNAELDAQRFLADPANTDEVVRLAQQQTEAMPPKALWNALFGAGTNDKLVGSTKLQFDFIVNDGVRKHLGEATAFLNTLPQKPASEPNLREGAVADAIAREILGERKLTSPIGSIGARPLADYKGS
jgi:NitT/TauT family transport system substrate-binding protein